MHGASNAGVCGGRCLSGATGAVGKDDQLEKWSHEMICRTFPATAAKMGCLTGGRHSNPGICIQVREMETSEVVCPNESPNCMRSGNQ